MIVAFVARGAFLARRKSRQSRALRLGLSDGDRVELGFFRMRKGDQVAAVIHHCDADRAIQRMRSFDGSGEHFHRAFSRQLLRCNRVHSFLLIVGGSLSYTTAPKKIPALARTRNVSATIVLMLWLSRRMRDQSREPNKLE